MPKQYVNLQREKKSEAQNSQFVNLKGKTDMPDSQDKVVWFFLEPDGKNLHLTKKEWFSPMARPVAYGLEPPFRLAAIVDKKEMRASLRLSLGGGDSFKVSVGKMKDKSDANDTGLPAFIVWRKIFVRLGAMAFSGGAAADIGTAQGVFAKLFIELEQEGGTVSVDHAPFSDDPSAVVVGMEVGSGPLSRPDQGFGCVFVDRIMRPGQFTVVKEYSVDDFKSSRLKELELPENTYTFPTKEKSWVTGLIFGDPGDEGVQFAHTNLHEFFYKGDGWDCPEGRVTNKLMIDFVSIGESLDMMLLNGKGKVTVRADVQTIASKCAGRQSRSSTIVATRLWWNAKPSSKVGAVALHEICHVLGMVQSQSAIHDPASGGRTGWRPNPNYYTGLGGVGPHCKGGGAALDKDGEMAGGSCVMFHASKSSTFCSECEDYLKVVDLSKLPVPL